MRVSGPTQREDMIGQRKEWFHVFGTYCTPDAFTDGNDTRPHSPGCNVGVVVDRSAGTCLHRGLVQRKRQHAGRCEFFFRMRTQVCTSTGNDLIDYCVQSADSLLLVLHSTRPPNHDRTSIVHRVVERRSSQNQPVDDGDRHADVLRRSLDQAARGHRAVQVQSSGPVRAVRIHAEHGRKHTRHAVHHHSQMAEPSRAENVQQCRSLSSSALPTTDHRGSVRRGQECVVGCHDYRIPLGWLTVMVQ